MKKILFALIILFSGCKKENIEATQQLSVHASWNGSGEVKAIIFNLHPFAQPTILFDNKYNVNQNGIEGYQTNGNEVTMFDTTLVLVNHPQIDIIVLTDSSGSIFIKNGNISNQCNDCTSNFVFFTP